MRLCSLHRCWSRGKLSHWWLLCISSQVNLLQLAGLGVFLSFVLTLSCCHWLQQCQLPRHVHMRISLSLMPTVQRYSSLCLCSKQSLSNAWVLLIYYSCICLEGGEECQEFIRVCIVIHIYLSFQHTSNLRLLFCTLKARQPSASYPEVSLALRVLPGQNVLWCGSITLTQWMGCFWHRTSCLLGSCPCGTMALEATPKGIYSDCQ